ncbi:M48 family metalloprotease [Telluribacter sp. SYSU D00476]|uniref:M48 family metalloprotease n=1 Tax=Telluribacter sp. SYSU D00476 TaxID=2811430 RepID=UPI001FF37699|nr:M48 family metalloprotease [Telluribacter sp. SYSU D00476]
MKYYFKPRYLVLAVALVLAQGCARNPVTGKREISLMSTEQEIAIGQQSHPSVVATFGLYEDQKLQNFIKTKGTAMAKISHRPDLPYQFHVVDSPVVNAFAVPGGYVYFTRGIMAHFNNEAEFAGVLGHEIGHITARHSARQQSGQLLSQIGLIAGLVIAPQLGGLAEAAQQGLGLLMLSYSRAHETESDQLGVEYSSKIGYDAREMADFFGTLKTLSDRSGQSLPTFQSTHPDPANREKKVSQWATEYQKANPGNYSAEREDYLRLIDGMVYGNDPKQGFVEDFVFYHPELKFQFPIPRNWIYENSPSQFQMAPKDGKSMMLLTLAQGNTVEEAAQNVVKQYNLQVVENQATTINGNRAMVLISRQAPQQGQQGQQQAQNADNTVQIATWLIQYGGNIYAMHGMSYLNQFTSNFRTFQSVAENFRSLSDPDKLNRKPDRIRIKSAPRDGTLQEVLQSLQMPANHMNDLAVLNGMALKDRVTRGTLIKTLSK